MRSGSVGARRWKPEWAACVLLHALSLALPCRSHADAATSPAGAYVDLVDGPASLAGTWSLRTGDDPAWASPQLDAGGWARVQVPGPLGRQGYPGYTGFVWYRLDLGLSDETAAAAREGTLGLRVGSVDSSYELYVEGRRLGSVGALPPHPRAEYDRHAVFAIPASAVRDDARLSIALRVWRDPLTRGFEGGITGGPVEIGHLASLEQARLRGDLPYLALSVLFGFAGCYHLYLFWHRRSLREYFWYGTTALLLGVYTFLGTQVRFALSDDYTLLKNLEFLTLYLLPVASVEFFYGVFHSRVPRLVRAIQVGSALLALVAIATPTLHMDIAVLTAWQYTMLLLTGGTFLLVLRQSARGHPEARIVVGAFGLLSLAILNDVLRSQGILETPSLMSYGFAFFVMAMAGSLANRFARAHAELEALNADLEARVRLQTIDLEGRAAELESKNKQLEDAYQQLHEVSVTDPLTGLHNRRFYLEHIGLDVARAIRDFEGSTRGARGTSSSALVFVLVDIDHFKRVNDRYGHDAGDEMLSRIGRSLRRVCRESDYVVRWGGEEFLVASHLADRAGATVLAERIRTAIAETDLTPDDEARISLTASVGFACFPFHEDEPNAVSHEAVLTLADACLYRVKESGRNAWLGALRGKGTARGNARSSRPPSWEEVEVVGAR